jgi:hypothetical protein
MLVITKGQRYHAISLTKPLKNKPNRQQRGALTIAISLVMLALALSSALYSAKTKLLDIRIANSELRKNQAHLSAQAGVQYAISQLEVEPNFVGDLDVIVGGGSFSVNVSQIVDAGVAAQAKTSNGVDRFYTLVSTGASDDNSGTRVIEQKVKVAPITNGLPDSAIMVAKGIVIRGAFTVGGNPNGAGQGVPLSIWSDFTVNLSGNGATCALAEFDNDACDELAYSNKNGKGMDIFEDDVEPMGTFPADIFAYIFGVPAADYLIEKEQAEQQLVNCDSLDVDDVGLIWVTGDCVISANTLVGSAATPVIIVVEDGDLQLNGGALIYGMVFSFSSVPGNGGTVSMVGNATIRGALIADHALDIGGGTFNTRFDRDVLDAMVNGSNRQFMSVRLVVGSWKDFN